MFLINDMILYEALKDIEIYRKNTLDIEYVHSANIVYSIQKSANIVLIIV